MAKVNLTAGRVRDYTCAEGANQSFLWDSDTPGLGVRATTNGAKSYIFQGKLNGSTLRVTIGDVKSWDIETGDYQRPGARERARQFQTMLDQGIDPRQVKIDAIAAKESKAAELKLKEAQEALTFGDVWKTYMEARKPFWGERHYDDHVNAMQTGGTKRKRSKKLTEPGTLASLAKVRLVDLNTEIVEEWAKVEGKKRPGRARLASRLLTVFLTWCSENKAYREIVKSNPVNTKGIREILGKAKTLDDVLQREQLKAWFSAVMQIGNPVISAYLQTLLLTGARPNELADLPWETVDFQWNVMTIGDKIEGFRTIPLTPYVHSLLSELKRINDTPPNVEKLRSKIKPVQEWEPSKWVFSSPSSASGHLEDPHSAHTKACAIAGLTLTIYGLRRSFATLCEWIEMPTGIAAQIQGHKPSGVREKHYIRRPIDLLRMWHVKIEAWILEQAGIKFIPEQSGLHAVNS